MDKGTRFLERLAESADMADAAIPGQPIVEIAGTHRVLVENHCGICVYSGEQIVVNVKFGSVTVCGCRLELMKMTRHQLVIQGKIHGVTLQRRD